MKVIKRDGKEVKFNKQKIIKAITMANGEVDPEDRIDNETINKIAEDTENYFISLDKTPDVEEIQDFIEDVLMDKNANKLAKHYIKYRYQHKVDREMNPLEESILTLVDGTNEVIKQENSNKNPIVNSTQRDYMAGELSRDITHKYFMPADILKAHKEGVIHFHDSDYFVQHMYNCCLINLDDILQNGTVISGTMIEKPHSFSTACNITTQVIAQVASNQYGGQSINIHDLAKFVDVSRKKFISQIESDFPELDEKGKKKLLNLKLKEDITRGIQMLQYQILTLMTTNGQAPFITFFMYLNGAIGKRAKKDLAMVIEEILKQRIQGVKNEKGVWITPAFPKLIYVLEEDNITIGSEYYYLTELAAKCTAKRMVPDYISEKVMKELKNGDCYAVMGCRSALTPWTDEDSKKWNIKGHKYSGRFNQGVVTINLVDVACSSKKDIDKFWKIFDQRLELCHRALRLRHERLLGTKSDVAPLLWQYGAIARLEKGEVIDKLLYNNYSTISLGYAGLYECVKYMTGKSHTDEEAKPFALSIMQKMNDKCSEWREKENISYSLYGTPIESTTYKFAKCLKNKFGIIPEVTDHNYITNSYHVCVREKIDAFTKLKFESEFQKLSPGGAISYIEVPNMQNNIPAIISVLQFIYNNIMYAELNTKSDYCQVCGFDGEIEIKEDSDGKLIWQCPNCGNTDQTKMNVVRRTCGYIGANFWNQGRTEEIKDRELHL